MKSTLSLFALLLFSTFSAAQSCPCGDQFAWLRQKIELNYSGFHDKVTPQTRDDYNRHAINFQSLTAAAQSDAECLRLLTEWTRWFHDKHIQLANTGAVDTAATRERFAAWGKIALSEADARLLLTQPDRDSIEGIYQAAEGNYRVALVRNSASGRDFAAIVLRADSVWWVPGQVKFDLKTTSPGQYTARYYMRDHTERNPQVSYQGGILTFKGVASWYRQFPGTPLAIARPHIFTLQQLDSTTLLLTLPTMNEGARFELDSLLQANQTLLASTPNLIIDCRNNGGGSDITFVPLRPYVYSGPVKGFKIQIYATADNAMKYEKLRKDKNFPKKYRLYFGHKARQMRRNKGRFVGKCGEFTDKFKKISPNPKRVAVLINGGCASSCEQFVYYAEQSNRVTLIGQHTAGIFDYGNLHFMDFPCGALQLAYPTSRSCSVNAGKGIDGVGIPPDVPVEDTVSDWIGFAKNYLHSH